MDAARLHDVATDVVNEYRNYEIQDKFSGLVGSLQRLTAETESDSSSREKIEDELEERLTALSKALDRCPSNEFRPSQVKVLEQIGGDKWTGEQLKDRVADVFQSESIRSQQAREELEEIFDGFKEFKDRLEALEGAMGDLGVPIVSLGGDEAELGVILPMQLGDVRLKAIYERFEELDHHLKHLAEVTGNRVGSVRIRAIATDSVELFVGGTLATGLALATIVEKLANAYKTVQEIRLHHREIKKRDESLEYITEEDIEGVIDRKLDEIRDEVMEYAPDDMKEGRVNELRKPVKDALSYFADLMDEGGELEVNVLLPPEGTSEEEEEDVDVPGWSSFRELYRSGGAMARLPREDRKILGLKRAGELPEGNGESEEDGEEEETETDTGKPPAREEDNGDDSEGGEVRDQEGGN